MTTQLPGVLSAKLDRVFAMLDADADGRLVAADLGGLARRLAEAFGREADHRKIGVLEEALVAFWHSDLERMDTDGDGTVDRAEFEAGVRAALDDHAEAFLDRFSVMVDAWMDVADTNGDGVIDLDEYVRMYSATLGFPASDLEVGFHKLDRDGDGHLSREEIRQATHEYYTGDDPEAPGNWLFGPL